jgi:hypothetical protein
MGIVALIRPVVLYLPLLLIPFFFLSFALKLKVFPTKAAGKALLVALVFILCLSPWLIRNYVHYGRFKFTAQSGEHLLQYIVPFVWQYSQGIPFIEGMKKANRAFSEKAKREGWDLQGMGPFEKSDLQVNMAIAILKQEPKSAFMKAWVFGIAKNLFAPAIVDLSYLLNIERPHYFSSKGRGLVDRAWNFISTMKGLFAWGVILSLGTLLLARVLQMWGLLHTLRYRAWDGAFLLLIVAYFLLVSGPVGYAKYRLPFEPILIILLAIGLRVIYERLSRSSHTKKSNEVMSL